MFSLFKKERDQKKLYFQLDAEFKKAHGDAKAQGIYAIFKDDLCLYVGQSKNIASRLATHLSGKYKQCSKILVFSTYDPEDDLLPLEKFAMQKLQPIENVLVDFTEDIKIEDLAEGEIVYMMDYCKSSNTKFDIKSAADITILNFKYEIFIGCDTVLDFSDNALLKEYFSRLVCKDLR